MIKHDFEVISTPVEFTDCGFFLEDADIRSGNIHTPLPVIHLSRDWFVMLAPFCEKCQGGLA
jgi:hypothetical protein